MGLWNWVKDRLRGDERATPVTNAPESGTTSALLEPPPDNAEAPTSEAPWWAPPDAHLTVPAAPPRPDMDAEERALENLLVAHFDGHDLSLPTLPRAPERVLQLLASKDQSLAKIAEEISEDQVTAASVLRLANSPLYRGLERITALEPAVVRLGANALRTLMMHLTLRTITGAERRGQHNWAETLSARALASGVIMRGLARFSRLEAEDCFLLGLMHDIGAVVVLRIVNSQTTLTHGTLRPEVFEYLCHEAHQEFGELLADAWALPPRLKAIIADHHGPLAPDDPYRRERLQLQLADVLAALLGFGVSAPYDVLQAPAIEEFGVARRPEFFRFLEGLPRQVEETMEIFA